MMNKYEKTFENFLETTTYEPIKKYTDNNYKYPIQHARETLKMLKSTNNITWEFIYNEISKKRKKGLKTRYLITWVLYAIELDKKGYLKGALAGQLSQNAEAIATCVCSNRHDKTPIFYTKEFNPFSIILTPIQTLKKKNNSVIIIEGLTFQQNQFILKYLDSPSASRVRTLHCFTHLLNSLVSNNCFYSNIDSYNDELFFQQFETIKLIVPKDKKQDYGNPKRNALIELIYFYNWIQSNMDANVRKNAFRKVTPEILKFPYLVNLLLNDYEIVNYSIYEEPPKSEKWIIQGQQMSLHKTAEADKLTTFDVTILKNQYLKRWIKECFWFDTSHHISSRSKDYNILFTFLKPIDDRSSDDEIPQFTKEDILTFKAKCMENGHVDSTVARKLAMVRFFLNFIDYKGYMTIDELTYRFLAHHDSKNNSYKETYTKEEIKQLLDVYKNSYENCENKDRKILYTLYYYIISIQSLSEMRISTILNLKTDSVVKTLERNGQDEYKVIVYSKASGREPDEYNITRYVKKLIDEAITLTADVRNESTGIEKDYVFIYKRYCNRKAISILRQTSLCAYHKNICSEHGIRQLSLGAIRNYYQQQVSIYVTNNGDDPLLVERLSKHGMNVHIQHYDTVDIKDFCQRQHQVEIGSIDLKGSVQETNDKSIEATVANGCGHCSQPTCVLAGNLDCLMCGNFVATLDCIPQFEKEIELIDEQILKEPLKHEKEFLNNKKRLNVAYLEKLYELEVEVNANKTRI